MSEATDIRTQTREMTQEEFGKAYKRDRLELIASEAGVKDDAISEAKTKADLVALIYKQYPAPDPALRGKSTIDSPVAAMWALLNDDLVKNGPEGRMRRKDGVAAGKALGIAHYTARTQYQAWFVETQKGTVALTKESDPKALPKALAVAWGMIEEKKEEAEAEA